MLKNLLTFLGGLLLVFAAYSYRQYKEQLVGDEVHVAIFPNTKILIELAAGFMLVLVGQLIGLKLKNIRVSSDIRTKSFEENISRNDFATFNTRGRAFAKRTKQN